MPILFEILREGDECARESVGVLGEVVNANEFLLLLVGLVVVPDDGNACDLEAPAEETLQDCSHLIKLIQIYFINFNTTTAIHLALR